MHLLPYTSSHTISFQCIQHTKNSLNSLHLHKLNSRTIHWAYTLTNSTHCSHLALLHFQLDSSQTNSSPTSHLLQLISLHIISHNSFHTVNSHHSSWTTTSHHSSHTTHLITLNKSSHAKLTHRTHPTHLTHAVFDCAVPCIEWPFACYAFDVLSSTKGTRVCGTCLGTSI